MPKLDMNQHTAAMTVIASHASRMSSEDKDMMIADLLACVSESVLMEQIENNELGDLYASEAASNEMVNS